MEKKRELELFTDNFRNFPGTRYMGSKNKILFAIWEHLGKLDFSSFLDAFAGSNVVSYFMKSQNKQVFSNDFLSFSYLTSKAIVENSSVKLSDQEILFLLNEKQNDNFIQKTFKDIFYSEEDNKFLDIVRTNIAELDGEYKQALAFSALVRACLKKRSRGIFTFVGERYNDGRVDMQKSMRDHFLESVKLYNNAVFDNHQENKAFNLHSEKLEIAADLVYLDPPYFSPKSDNDYVRRYHFIEGLVKNWDKLTIQNHTAVKKFQSYDSPFSKKESAVLALENLISKFRKSILVISYSSNSLPNKEQIVGMLQKFKSYVEVHEIKHTYSMGNQNHKIGNANNRIQEYLFIGK